MVGGWRHHQVKFIFECRIIGKQSSSNSKEDISWRGLFVAPEFGVPSLPNAIQRNENAAKSIIDDIKLQQIIASFGEPTSKVWILNEMRSKGKVNAKPDGTSKMAIQEKVFESFLRVIAEDKQRFSRNMMRD